jgi:hypothetical protein
MEKQGKLTGQTKFPRVMKNKLWDQWENFIKEKKGLLVSQYD